MPDERCVFCDARVQNVPSQHSGIVRLLDVEPNRLGLFQIVHATDRTYSKAVNRSRLPPAIRDTVQLYDEHRCEIKETSF